MTSFTLPPQDYSGPLSKRAVQLLRELQGLKVLDSMPTLAPEDTEQRPSFTDQVRAEPKLAVEDVASTNIDLSKKKEKSSSKWTKKPFTREEYLKEIRGNLLGGMILALVGLVGSLVAVISLTGTYFSPAMEDIKRKSEEITQIPALSISLEQQINNQKQSLQAVQKNLDSLTNYFPSPSQAQVSYAHFLTILESQKVLVNAQLGGISQSAFHPHLSTDKSKQVAQQTTQVLANATGKPPEPPKLPALSAEVKPGINYYHMEFTFEGGYVGYLIARQSLVNEIPNTIIHSESVKSAKNPGLMEIHVYMSIPFISKN